MQDRYYFAPTDPDRHDQSAELSGDVGPQQDTGKTGIKMSFFGSNPTMAVRKSDTVFKTIREWPK
jgi:hypothetical protein